jgi:hypothetical protein
MDTTDISPMYRVAHAALACLRRDEGTGATVALPNGGTADIAYRGPGVPERLPEDIADYEMVRGQAPSWTGAHRLVVRAPLVVLDLAWNADEPVRILVCCRGDWEAELLERLE